MKDMKKTPSIAKNLSTTLWLWFLIFSAAVGMAVWLQTDSEVSELLDDSLIAAADVIQENLPSIDTVASTARRTAILPKLATISPGTDTPQQRFAWQWVSTQGELKGRSPSAPMVPWRASAQIGLFDDGSWRVFGQRAVFTDGVLYVAQSQAERRDAIVEVVLGAVLSVLAIGIAGHFWLRQRISAELAPIKALSERMLQWNAGSDSLAQRPWGVPEREELVAVHAALDTLSANLEAQIAQERAFSAHTSHALRTPLSGIDTQLAVALRETHSDQTSLRDRLDKIRFNTQRMQRVVESLLSLFRFSSEVQRELIDIDLLITGIALPANLSLHATAEHTIHADPDLLSAALFNLIDNSVRYGATSVHLTTSHTNTLVITDDGLGVSVERLQHLRMELQGQHVKTNEAVGMGLWLAQRVANVHGGQLGIACAENCGLVVTLTLGSRD